MITRLSIKNYALIDDLKVDFRSGLTIITGETGAGKSIILGALSLLLGKRADLSSVRDTSSKCFIEGEFDVGGYGIQQLFEENDLDYDPHTIVRREILPSGKSRAFVNDTPVTLNQLQALGASLVDIHSQHQTLSLSSESFQFDVVDSYAGNGPLLSSYFNKLNELRTVSKSLDRLKEQRDQAHKELDYNTFLYNELEEAKLEGLNLEELEEDYEKLSNSELIQESLGAAIDTLQNETFGSLERLKEARNVLSKIQDFTTSYGEFWMRMNSAIIELEDLSEEMQNALEYSEAEPQKLIEINDKLQLIYKLQQKHASEGITQLLELKEELADKIDVSHGLDGQITGLESDLAGLRIDCEQLSMQLHEQRNKVIPQLEEKIEGMLTELGMPNGRIKFDLNRTDDLRTVGMNSLELQFTANLGSDFGPLKKVASGGELSRIMLSIKSILARYKQLPTIIFDEIDTGVSGEVAYKMASIMNEMSNSIQLLTITHLPQVAAKGDHHILVYKEDVNAMTETRLKVLESDERIVEIAKMIGGNNITEATLANARELLN